MGSLFRSEELSLCQLFLQTEASHNTISELGELGLVQFRDLNPDVNSFQRKFIHEVQRCDEMERRLRYIENEVEKEEIVVLETDLIVPCPPAREMVDLESTLEKIEKDLKSVISNGDALRKTFFELTELKHVLIKTQLFFDQSNSPLDPTLNDEVRLIGPGDGIEAVTSTREGHPALQLSFVAGVIDRTRVNLFERMLWRVCRGNVYMRSTEIEDIIRDPIYPDEVVHKTVFIIFFQGEQLKTRVRKISEGCRATIYPCPDTQADREKMIVGVTTRIEDLDRVILQTKDHRQRILFKSSQTIKTWFTKVRKLKAIYVTLNQFNFDMTQKCLIGECWCPNKDMDRIRSALRAGTEKSGSTVPSILNRMDTTEEPPTFNRTNKFTSSFQAIVNAYGVANYKEVNPAPYTIITFPFLFAVMFGDAGHGVIMSLFAIALIWKERAIISMRSKNEIFNMFFGGRYVILLMGLFSIYTGLIYNDVFSKSINVFGSGFTRNMEAPLKRQEMLDPRFKFEEPYWFGVDPVWQVAKNKIQYLNTYKMKLSVILGVSQMLFGTTLSLFNHTYFKKAINIWCEFIPQVIFLLSIFGYMIFLIVFKFFHYSAGDSNNAPSILITMINMFLQKELTDKDRMFGAQSEVQTVLLLLALISVPWMLVIKPVILYRQNKAKVDREVSRRAGVATSQTSLANGGPHDSYHSELENGVSSSVESATTAPKEHTSSGGGHGGEHGEFDLGDIIVHQAIHTIEYCLGSISHTASYLRLWALSLAHAQLSEVLWSMIMKLGLNMTGLVGGILMVFFFAFFAILTVGVLLMMEGLSAFLHALRLHWVEFQSKFYSGSGIAFEPFSFKRILDLAESEV